jgi:cell division protein FtsB
MLYSTTEYYLAFTYYIDGIFRIVHYLYMLPLGKITDFTRLITPPVIGALVVGYFAYHSLKGDHGLSAYLLLTAEVIKAESVLAERVGERTLIERRTKLLGPENLDLDTLDERARAVLNLLEEDERVILD